MDRLVILCDYCHSKRDITPEVAAALELITKEERIEADHLECCNRPMTRSKFSHQSFYCIECRSTKRVSKKTAEDFVAALRDKQNGVKAV